MPRSTARLRIISAIGLSIFLSSWNRCEAANDPKPTSSQLEATTTSDIDIAPDRLQIVLRPLTKAQLDAELTGWLRVLSNRVEQVGNAEWSIKTSKEHEDGKEKGQDKDKKQEQEKLKTLKDQLIKYREQELLAKERTKIVMKALQKKGGDTKDAEQFIAAISDLDETTDATSRRAAVIVFINDWVQRDDGGKLMLKKTATALVILLLAWVISKFAGSLTARAISRSPKTSLLLVDFVRRTTGGTICVIGVLMAFSTLGVQVAPMLAALGAGGFIVGFALQETLGSFASGMMIMIYRPFDVDDFVSVAGVEGTVKEMSLVATTLLTVDNKVLVIPNKKAWGDVIVNYTGKHLRRIDLVFGIGYGDDIQHAVRILQEIANQHPLVLEAPQVNVNVDTLADSSVNLFCRPWVKTKDYWNVRWDLIRQVKERFDAEGISIPYPQRDLHMYSDSQLG
ncbi:MAG: mechanosensitive ion channel family protein [Planctomycetaceae bacterium]|nr:mechanosensitive ion channel family protein [Planctomycetaceae bacterium]